MFYYLSKFFRDYNDVICFFRWKIDNFTENLKDNIMKTEAENSGGEISVRLPSETMPLVEGAYYTFGHCTLYNYIFNCMIS